MRSLEGGVALLLGLAVLACSSAPPGASGPRFRAVRPPVAFEMMRDSPQLVVLDVRPFDEYAAPGGHLDRATSVPLAELDFLWPLLDLSAEDTVLIYSGDGGELQIAAAHALIARGLRYVVQIQGGLQAWVEQGFAVVAEDAPISRPRR
jgi:rhodanese-related sulfurtransferase